MIVQNGNSFLRPLIYISHVVGLAFPNLLYCKKHSLCYVMYACFIIILLISTFVWSLFEKISNTYKYFINALAVLDALINLNMTTTNVISIAILTLKAKKCKNFYSRLSVLDEFLQIKGGYVNKRRWWAFIVELIFVHAIMMITFSYDVYAYLTTFGWKIYKYYPTNFLSEYMVSVTVLQIYNLSLGLKQRFSVLNKRLYKYVSSFTNRSYFETNDANFLLKFLKSHDELCDLIDLINDCFGIQILAITTMIALHVIAAVNFSLVLVTGKQEPILDVSVVVVMILYIILAFDYLGFGFMIVTSCDMTIREARYTIIICHKLLLKLPIVPNTPQEKFVREELLQLAHQVTQRKPHFSAAGFFTVDYTMLYAILGSIVTYVLIIIQFE